MNIVIVPDTHGRDFWKKACNTEADKIIFLGDYLDHYPDESTYYHDIANFLEILDFKRKFPDKVILLIGNHKKLNFKNF